MLHCNSSRQNRFKCCNLHDHIYIFLDNGVMTTPKRGILSFVFTVLCFKKQLRHQNRNSPSSLCGQARIFEPRGFVDERFDNDSLIKIHTRPFRPNGFLLNGFSVSTSGPGCSKGGYRYPADKYCQNKLRYPLDSAIHPLNDWGLGCNLSYIVDLFAALHELASASAHTLLN